MVMADDFPDHTRRAMREILQLAHQRQGKTTCPSEVARLLAEENAEPDQWRSYMARVHDAADQLNALGKICLSWKSKVLTTRIGPYRIRLPADEAKN